MCAAPAGTSAGRRDLVPGLLAFLMALALFEAVFATPRARLALLVIAALAGLAIAGSWRARRAGRAQRQALERALQVSRANAQHLSQVARELRTPLDVIGGMGELLERAPLPASHKDYVAAIRRSSAQLLRTIEDLLDVSRLEEDAPPSRETGFSLSALVGETARAVAPLAEAKGLTLVCDMAPGLPDPVRGDPERLRRALERLLHHAVKVSERGEVVLRVRPGADEGGRDLVHFSASDCGTGPPAAEQERTDLGLAVATRLVEQMSGRIQVDSEPGRGTRFHFAIPLDPGPASPSVTDAVGSLRGLRVLIVESGAVERETLGELVRSLGLEPTLLGEAHAVVEELHRAAGEGRPYAVVLFDASMRGSAAFRARRKEDDPIVAVTPRVQLWTQTRLAAAAQLPGPRVLKPATRGDLLAAIQQALRGETSAAAGVPAPEETGRGSRADRARVLVVDENPVRAFVTSRVVELAGGEAVLLARPDAVEGVLASQEIAVVVLDRAHPDHGRCETRLREWHPGLAVVHAPVEEAELRAVLTPIRRDPVPPPAANEPLLDRPRLVRNLGDDEQAADEVLSTFVAQAGDSLDSLRAACAAGDLPSIARAAHRLKGSLLWVGADRAAREAGILETRANAGDAAGARTAFAVVEGQVRAVVAFIRGTSSTY
jgi:signal transduction histidine kinase/HPt (histidine-containing phosphotransfer) domain-containing protein